MRSKNLLIIFVKNLVYGKVKTRLAKTIGHKAAMDIYKELIEITYKETKDLAVTRHIYFSQKVEETLWVKDEKFIQQGEDLGEKMKNAFQKGFDDGYEHIIIIGSDLSTITDKIIDSAFRQLETNDLVFGPATDGGYYLMGMSRMTSSVFFNKPWSTSNLLKRTLEEEKKAGKRVFLLETLNDIDTYQDLIESDFYKNNSTLQELIQLKS